MNGVLIPGGGAYLSPRHPFYDTAAQLVALTLDANNKGDYFPVIILVLVIKLTGFLCVEKIPLKYNSLSFKVI